MKKKKLHLNYKLRNKVFKKLKQRVKIKLNLYTGSSNYVLRYNMASKIR